MSAAGLRPFASTRGARLALRHAALRNQARSGKCAPAFRRAEYPGPESAHHSRRRHERQRFRLRDDRFNSASARLSHRTLHLPSPRHFSRTHSGQRRKDFGRGCCRRPNEYSRLSSPIGIRIRLFSKSQPPSLFFISRNAKRNSSFSKPAWADGSMQPMPRNRSSPSSRRSISIIKNGWAIV